MLLNAVIIVLREALEAVSLITLFLVFSYWLKIPQCWLIAATLSGFAGALAFAMNIDDISQWMNGVGQELTNASLQIVIAVLLQVFNSSLIAHHQNRKQNSCLLYFCLTTSVTFIVSREGAEILLYVSSFFYMPEQLQSVLMGGAIGAGIGLSIGIILFYCLILLSRVVFLPIGIFIVILISAGMIGQAIQQLIQADLLPSQLPLWDSSGWLDEESVGGQLLYALIGYEATPTPIQVLFYFSSIVLMLLLVILALWRNRTVN